MGWTPKSFKRQALVKNNDLQQQGFNQFHEAVCVHYCHLTSTAEQVAELAYLLLTPKTRVRFSAFPRDVDVARSIDGLKLLKIFPLPVRKPPVWAGNSLENQKLVPYKRSI